MFRGSICLEIAWACFPLIFRFRGATGFGPAATQKKIISKNHVPGLYLAWNSVFELSIFMDYFWILGGKKNFRTKKFFDPKNRPNPSQKSKNMRSKCAYFQVDLSLLSMFFGRFTFLHFFCTFSPTWADPLTWYLVTIRAKSWEAQICAQNAPNY